MACSSKLTFDPYEILGLKSSCSDGEIDKAYKKSALKWHPDKAMRNGISKEESEKKFGQIYQAYQFLKDEGQRVAYDEEIANKKRRMEYEDQRRSVNSARRQNFEDKLREREEAFENRKRKNPQTKTTFNLDKELERLKKEGAAYLAKMAEEERKREDEARQKAKVTVIEKNEDQSIYNMNASKLKDLEDDILDGL
ncbi:unnamed protein product [Bursaphelenchus okinawaensis]|uniref:J domain-containing protein n=1 Tax=Bursaphelenchus okinawaensis TaxID=465554 RepID=A0A811JT90_9BILA|nr:unnamed protein product [Bursaphelenchus okinawaensis]CAG9082249.1 unnamed protein product [Bursaphelenchus okinawaensis]